MFDFNVTGESAGLGDHANRVLSVGRFAAMFGCSFAYPPPSAVLLAGHNGGDHKALYSTGTAITSQDWGQYMAVLENQIQYKDWLAVTGGSEHRVVHLLNAILEEDLLWLASAGTGSTHEDVKRILTVHSDAGERPHVIFYGRHGMFLFPKLPCNQIWKSGRPSSLQI